MVCNTNHDDLDMKIPTILWVYKTTYKRLKRQKSFKLVYGKETVMSMEYIIPSLRISAATDMTDAGVVEEILVQLLQLEDDWFNAGFH